MTAQTKFQSAPSFTGREEEDVVNLIHRCEKVARYNPWEKNELRDHVELSLEGVASKWYACMDSAGNLPSTWSYTPEPPVVQWSKSTRLLPTVLPSPGRDV